MRGLVSLRFARPVKRGPRAGIIVGLTALVVEGVLAFASLAAVGVITAAYLTGQAALSVAGFLSLRRAI